MKLDEKQKKIVLNFVDLLKKYNISLQTLWYPFARGRYLPEGVKNMYENLKSELDIFDYAIICKYLVNIYSPNPEIFTKLVLYDIDAIKNKI